jgi:osmoprotectant transport system permease protein
MRIVLPLLALLLLAAAGQSNERPALDSSSPVSKSGVISVGSKSFTESYILAEMAAQLLEHEGYSVERQLGLGGTLIAYRALREGAIDLYPEYTGTISQAILQQDSLSAKQLAQSLREEELQLLPAFGFNNGYAIAVSERIAVEHNLQGISQLAALPELRLGFSLEFLNRGDGWPALRAHYQLPHKVRGLEHALAYAAIAADQLDATDAYTTDGELNAFSLRLLADDRQFFPRYEAAILARDDLDRGVRAILSRMAGTIDERSMRAMNASVSESEMSPAQVATRYLQKQGLVTGADRQARATGNAAPGLTSRVSHNILVHLKLTTIALLLACLVALPGAVLVSRNPDLARGMLYATGLLQTIPSLALLALMIPLLGLGELPAITALFLYSLMPIVRNTLAGLFSVDPVLKQVASGMGLTSKQQMRHIELPLAAPMILAGIKTAAIISIGTATLAAFVGAGGLGEPIITGLTLNDHRLILEGAIPAAGLAIVVELLFESLERRMAPPQLQNREN